MGAKRWVLMGEKTFAVAVLIGLALCHAAMADRRATVTATVFARAVSHKITTRRTAAPGVPPGAGYCWYYIDRRSRTPGFWDLCRGR
jgi:hypothetical protein